MKRSFLLALAAVLAACSSSPTLPPDGSRNDQFVAVNGALRLEAEDFPTQGGVLWALPSVTATNGAVVVTSTQYGSLCRFALSGDAAITGHTIGVHVVFSERATACTAEIRALRYTATVSGLSGGSYDVSVIHDYGGKPDTLVRRTVSVP